MGESPRTNHYRTLTHCYYKYSGVFILFLKSTILNVQGCISIFYMYLCKLIQTTYDFVIDLDNVWQWLGFNQKSIAK